MKAFRWQQWLLLAVFLLVAGFTAYKTVHTVHRLIYWKTHRDEPIRGWMTIGYVAHSYRVPPDVLYQALDLPNLPPDRRPLREIAKARHRSMQQIATILQDAIVQVRSPHPPPPDRGSSTGRIP